ncbi:unnamed protein product [Cyprideis torosa]|uniref:Uncharacterized protein n=1 Tax=Cyprideis torosa TaxID=163714 RepID=A0A7R8ZGS6_9CRUS|nr:unnamed protein product [Cyprideis torosa]CAG0882084.1 unnamed protein product [Cyprideis torosa]
MLGRKSSAMMRAVRDHLLNLGINPNHVNLLKKDDEIENLMCHYPGLKGFFEALLGLEAKNVLSEKELKTLMAIPHERILLDPVELDANLAQWKAKEAEAKREQLTYEKVQVEEELLKKEQEHLKKIRLDIEKQRASIRLETEEVRKQLAKNKTKFQVSFETLREDVHGVDHNVKQVEEEVDFWMHAPSLKLVDYKKPELKRTYDESQWLDEEQEICIPPEVMFHIQEEEQAVICKLNQAVKRWTKPEFKDEYKKLQRESRYKLDYELKMQSGKALACEEKYMNATKMLVKELSTGRIFEEKSLKYLIFQDNILAHEIIILAALLGMPGRLQQIYEDVIQEISKAREHIKMFQSKVQRMKELKSASFYQEKKTPACLVNSTSFDTERKIQKEVEALGKLVTGAAKGIVLDDCGFEVPKLKSGVIDFEFVECLGTITDSFKDWADDWHYKMLWKLRCIQQGILQPTWSTIPAYDGTEVFGGVRQARAASRQQKGPRSYGIIKEENK